MATCIFRGDAPKIAQVQTFAFGGTWEANDIIRVTFSTGRYYDFTAGSTTTATVVSNLVTAWNLLSAATYPEWAEITASANTTTLSLTHDTAGTAFAVTLTPLETGGGAADAQTIEGAGTATTGTTATANSGPNDWSVAANWSGGAVPANGDTVYIENSNVDILYGLSQSGVTLAALYIPASYTGKIGLPTTHAASGTAAAYYEYRATELAIGATIFQSGHGDGQGSGRLKINFGSVQTACTVVNTGTTAETGLSAFLFRGTHSSNVLSVFGGTVGVAQLAGQSATLATLNITSTTGGNRFATVYCGTGLGTGVTVVQSGGALTLNAGTTSLTIHGGTCTLEAGAHPIIDNQGGYIVANTSGTLAGTSLTVGSTATLDFDQSAVAKTVTADITCYRGATVKNGNATLATLNLDPVGCRLEDIKLTSKAGSDVTIA
tara:strand:- start:362 stop:1666 length:1305 start_codon:yes stop_codon:yes gene_type:complete